MKSVLQREQGHDSEGAGWLKFGQLGSLDWVEMFPVGPHAVHGWIYSSIVSIQLESYRSESLIERKAKSWFKTGS